MLLVATRCRTVAEDWLAGSNQRSTGSDDFVLHTMSLRIVCVVSRLVLLPDEVALIDSECTRVEA